MIELIIAKITKGLKDLFILDTEQKLSQSSRGLSPSKRSKNMTSDYSSDLIQVNGGLVRHTST
jgi:hypothetical protein